MTTSTATTARTITTAQIKTLRYEAHMAGDDKMVAICDRALKGRGGKTECAKAINDARYSEVEGNERDHAYIVGRIADGWE